MTLSNSLPGKLSSKSLLMAFLTGLVQQAKLNASKCAFATTSPTETRHGPWTLIDNWNTNPFAGIIDTVYPYANQILDITNAFVVPNYFPSVNTVLADPRQAPPQMSLANGTTSPTRTDIIYSFHRKSEFKSGREYIALCCSFQRWSRRQCPRYSPASSRITLYHAWPHLL